MTDKPKLYRYKPQTRAVQYTGDNVEILRLFGLGNTLTMEIDEYSKSIEIWKDSFNKINIEVGDYVIYGGCISKELFERDYEPVEEPLIKHQFVPVGCNMTPGGITWVDSDFEPIIPQAAKTEE